MTDTELSTFDPDVAGAVVRVLRRHGVDAWLTDAAPDGGGERAVHVAPRQREPALSVLTEHMEEVNGELAERRTRVTRDGAGDDAGAQPHDRDRPLVMERFRRIALNLAVVLAPLLIISLARPPFPLALTLVTLIGGMAVIVALRNRQTDGEDR